MCVVHSVSPFAPNNFFAPYDAALRMASWEDKKFWKKTAWRLHANVEFGSTGHARSIDSEKVNLPQIYDKTESVLGMLNGIDNPEVVDITRRELTPYGSQPLDDGVRGNVRYTSSFEMTDITLQGRYWLPIDFLPGYFSFNLALPMRRIEVSDPVFEDLTTTELPVDRFIKRNLSGPTVLPGFLEKYGGLRVNGWNKTGIGDLTGFIEWHNYYRQDKESLRNVYLFAMLGFSAPTASIKDEDNALSVSLGNDGAWGVPLGLGLMLEFTHNFRFGIDAQFLMLFDETHVRRLKLDENQTELLILKKGNVTREHGLTWKFNIYWQWYHAWRGLSCKALYQYVKRDEDRLLPVDNTFGYTKVNSSEKLHDWNMHHLIFQVNYDCFQESKDFILKPQISLFYKLPIAGKGVIQPHTFGGQIAFNF